MSSAALSVWFRVDASVRIGAGHVMRCLALADALREATGNASVFVCRAEEGHLGSTIERHGHRLVMLRSDRAFDSQEDAREVASALRDAWPGWLVVDHYGLDVRWESALRPLAGKILAIDDLADRPHDCDVLLDQNFYASHETRYRGLLPAQCRPLLGPRYALLRPEFAAQRRVPRERNGTSQRVLVSFGGMDADSSTLALCRGLAEWLAPDIAVDVVVGASNPRRAEIEEACARRPGTKVYFQAENMAQLMARADLAVGAGGSTTWERCCLGLPAVAVVVAENQRQIVEDMCEAGMLAAPVGDSIAAQLREVPVLVNALMRSPALLRGMSRRCMELVDGNGAVRTVGVMLGTGAALRRARPDDCDRVHAWRNHPEVRLRSRNTAPIPLESHRAWYAQALADPNRILLIAESGAEAVGVVRFDISGASSEISVYLAPERLAGGWGAEILRSATAWLRENRNDVAEVVAQVQPGNPASLGAFKRAGYVEQRVVLAARLP